MKRRRQRHIRHIDAGFTFVETLAVLAVTAILAGQVGVAANRVLQRARIAGARAQIEAFKMALQSYYVDCGSFPTDEQGLPALWQKPTQAPVPAQWNGPYTDRMIPKDPWGQAYRYVTAANPQLPPDTPDGLPFAVYSLGADGAEGGEGNGKDIVSWQ